MIGRCALAAALALGFPADATAAAKLVHGVTVRSEPGGRVVGRLAATRPLTGNPTVVPVTARRPGWLRVRLPRRPNGTVGWIPARATVRVRRPWRIVVVRRRRVARVMRGDRRVRRFRVVVGAPATPTPVGRFFVAERVRQPRGSALGPWVLATSAYSNVLQEFDGGPGQIGLHGRTGLPEPLGSAASHGCMRFSDGAIAWLARRAKPGTVVVIRR